MDTAWQHSRNLPAADAARHQGRVPLRNRAALPLPCSRWRPRSAEMHARSSGHACSPHAAVLHTKGTHRKHSSSSSPTESCRPPSGFSCHDIHRRPPAGGVTPAPWEDPRGRAELRAKRPPPQRREQPSVMLPPPIPLGRSHSAAFGGLANGRPYPSVRLSASFILG